MTTTTVMPQGGLEVSGTAPVGFTHGGGQVAADLVVEWDFDNDGDFDEPVEDITSLVMSAETSTGRDWASNLTGKVQPGQLAMTLDNRDDRFSYFNTASPLTAAPFSLRTGRRVRVRTAESTPDDPVLLVRDRFNRTDAGSLGAAETGHAWTPQLNGGFDVQGRQAVAAAGSAAADTVSTVDSGATDHYVQATVARTDPNLGTGLVARWLNASNYIRAYIDGQFFIFVEEVVAGTPAVLANYGVTPWPGMTIGLGVAGTTVTVYVGGVAVIEDVTSLTTGTEVGLYAIKGDTVQRPPALDDFNVWDHVAAETEGVLWTGTVTEVQPSVELGPFKATAVTAEGVLAQAAATDIQAPRVPKSGNLTGLLVGDALARAGLCHPPAPAGLDLGTVDTGPVGVDDRSALTVARLGEETEIGFLHESNEGYPGFQSKVARATATPQSHFSDTAGTGQFGFASIDPLDHKREIVNRVTAGVAPSEPAGISVSIDTNSTSAGVANHVDITLPTTAAGDLILIIARRASEDAGDDWVTPIWWSSHRNDNRKDSRTQIFSHHCDGTESGDTVRFYTDSGAEGLPWIAHIYRIQDWYLATQGINVTEFRGGRQPPAMDHGWGRVSALYIAAYTGCHGGGAGSVVGTTFPDGYGNGQTNVFTTPGDVFISTAEKIDTVDAEAPSAFAGDDDFALVESVLIAVRGFNGEHEVLPTIRNPNRFGPSPGRFVTVEDTDSQDDHNVIRSHVNASNLFATEADARAYGEGVLAAYSDDRPIVTIEWPATISAATRAEAARRRVGDMVWLTADAATGLGVGGPFFVENIGHRWSDAGTQWSVAWELSPA